MASKGPKPATTAKSPAKPVAKRVAQKAAPAKAKVEPVKAPAPKPVEVKPVALAIKAEAPKVDPVIAKPEPAPPAPAPVAKTVAAPVEKPAAPAVTKTEETKPVIETPIVAAVAAPVMTKEVKIMEATIKNATDKTQAMFGDMNARAKSAMEKSTKLFEEANEFSKGNIEAIVESSKIAAKGAETMGQDAAAYAKKSFEHATATLKSLSSIKSPTDFFKLQSDYVRGAFDAMVAESSKSTEAMLKLAGEVAQPISNRLSVAAEKVKAAA